MSILCYATAGNNVQDFISECVIMKDFDHPNILGLVGVSFDETACLPLVVLPFMANGDLRHFLHSKHDFNHDTVVSSFPEVRMNQLLLTVVNLCVFVWFSWGLQWLMF